MTGNDYRNLTCLWKVAKYTITAIIPSSSRVVIIPIIHRLFVQPPLVFPALKVTPSAVELYSAFIMSIPSERE